MTRFPSCAGLAKRASLPPGRRADDSCVPSGSEPLTGSDSGTDRTTPWYKCNSVGNNLRHHGGSCVTSHTISQTVLFPHMLDKRWSPGLISRTPAPTGWRGRLRAAGRKLLRGDAAGRLQHRRVQRGLPGRLTAWVCLTEKAGRSSWGSKPSAATVRCLAAGATRSAGGPPWAGSATHTRPFGAVPASLYP